MIDYTILYRASLPAKDDWPDSERWDLFLSAFNQSDRVKAVYAKAHADTKVWFTHPEYCMPDNALPSGTLLPEASDESEFIATLLRPYDGSLGQISICVDITGMMRPHIMILTAMLFARGVRKFDAIYSEPDQYVKQERTQFSILPVTTIRPVLGFEGNHSTATDNDLLVIGSGYDDALIAQIAEHKRSARKRQIFGLPSLRPDMYQENVLSARRAAEAIGASGSSYFDARFAPANDPFVAASVVQSIVTEEQRRRHLTNLYLCPLSTKPQALGFALFYLHELAETAASILFPFSRAYTAETSVGVSKIWKYTVEMLSEEET